MDGECLKCPSPSSPDGLLVSGPGGVPREDGASSSSPAGPFAKEAPQTGGLSIRGSVGPSGNPGALPGVPQVGWAYEAADAGVYGGLAATKGDLIYCVSASPVRWAILQSDSDDAGRDLVRASLSFSAAPLPSLSLETETAAGVSSVQTVDVSALAVDENVVHKTGNETAGGVKTFTSPVVADVKTDASARLLSERLADVVNVKDYGAKGDGVTDDVDAIRAAVAAVDVEKGGTVFFPAGKYVCLGRVSFPENNLHIAGAGSASTVIISNGQQAIFGPAPGQTFYQKNIQISGITFDGNTFASGSVNAALVRFWACEDIKIYDCVFKNSSGYGLGFQARPDSEYSAEDYYGIAKNVLIDNCVFLNNGWGITDGDTHDGVDIKFVNGCTVSNCSFVGNKDCGLDIRGIGVNVVNCYSSKNSTGFEFHISDFTTTFIEAQEAASFNVSNLYSDGDALALGIIQDNYATTSPRGLVANISNILVYKPTGKGVYILAPSASVNLSNVEVTGSDATASNGRAIDIATAKTFFLTNFSIRNFKYGIMRSLDSSESAPAARNQEVQFSASNGSFSSVLSACINVNKCNGKVSGCDFGSSPVSIIYQSEVQFIGCRNSNFGSMGSVDPVSNADIRLFRDQSISWPNSNISIGRSVVGNKNCVTVNGALACTVAPAADDDSSRVPTTEWVNDKVETTVFTTPSTMSDSSVDLSGGTVFIKSVIADTAFIFTGVPSGKTAEFMLLLSDGGAYTVTWPSSVKWAGGVAPTLTASGTDVLRFVTSDGGTTWYGRVDVADAS